MITLLKIEATLFLVTLAAVLFFWLVGKGCEGPRDGRIRDLAFCLGRISMFSAIVLVLCMAITGMWAFL